MLANKVSIFPRLAISVLLFASLFMMAVLLLSLLNPISQVTQPNRFDEPVFNLYIDNSASMYPYRDDVKDFLSRVGFWPGKVRVWSFSDSLEILQSYQETDFGGNGSGFIDFEELSLNMVRTPTLFSPLQENIFFGRKEHYYVVMSDFLFRDGFTDLKGEGITNLFYLQAIGDDPPAKSAVFILNQDYHIFSDESYSLKLLFYSDGPQERLRYRIYYQTPQGYTQGPQEGHELKRGETTTESHYRDIELMINFPVSDEDWLHLGVDILGEEGHSDHINLFPPKKKMVVQMVYFQVNRTAFSIKNSLDRYRDYQVETLYLGKKMFDQEVQARIESILSKRNVFFLISPPPEALEWFREKEIPFVHIPGTLNSSQENSIRDIMVGDLDYSLPPIDFMGERALSEERWQVVAPRLEGLPLSLEKGDIPFHRREGKSAFFIRGSEMYWGIKHLIFLNDNILQNEEGSYWDIFLTKTIDFFVQRTRKDKNIDPSHNFFLGERVVNTRLPHLIFVGEDNHISPELSKAGVYPAPDTLPPYNYRIPFEEYFPPPPPAIPFSDKEQLLNQLASFQDKPESTVEWEIPFRELPLYGYLLGLMIFLFVLLLLMKWYESFRLG